MKKINNGFTLIEVLIALAILSIALTAIIRSTTQNIKDNSYLYNKTIATWVGTEVVNEARVNVLKLREGDEIEKETTMLGQNWPWLAELAATPNVHIKKITVTVYSPTTHDELAHLESYLYVQP
jgi:general secretion pathway protein I